MEEQYIFGRNPVIEILKSEEKIDRILVLRGDLKGSIKKIMGIAKDRNILVQEVNQKTLDELSNNGVHQGVIAVISPYTYSTIYEILEEAKNREEPPFIIILDEIKDPYNLGSIIRTAEGAGAHGIVIPERRAASVNSTVYSASAGGVQHIKIARVTNINRTIDTLKEEGLWIYGADIKGEKYYNANLKGPIGLVIGSEGKGISKHIKKNCDLLLNIPMKGKISSLNASNAAAILMYEVVRQNNG